MKLVSMTPGLLWTGGFCLIFGVNRGRFMSYEK
jgi:hypothetical protein